MSLWRALQRPGDGGLEDVEVAAMTSNSTVGLSDAAGDGGVGRNDGVISHRDAFQDSVSAAYPNVAADSDGLGGVYYLVFGIENMVEICIHNEDIPRQETLTAKGYLFLANDFRCPSKVKTITYGQGCTFPNADFAASSYPCLPFKDNSAPDIPLGPIEKRVLMSQAVNSKLYHSSRHWSINDEFSPHFGKVGAPVNINGQMDGFREGEITEIEI